MFRYSIAKKRVEQKSPLVKMSGQGIRGSNLKKVMNPKTFYGSMSAVRLPDIESEVPDLSNEDDNNPPIILAPESDYEELDEVQNRGEQTVTPETESSDDNIPLSVMREKLRKQEKQRPHWTEGNLIKSDSEIQFTGSQDLPSIILDLDSPPQFFKFLFPDGRVHYRTVQLYSVQDSFGKFDMPLLDTKLAIADALCKTGQLTRLNKVGRPSKPNPQQIQDKSSKKVTEIKIFKSLRKATKRGFFGNYGLLLTFYLPSTDNQRDMEQISSNVIRGR
nr:unnamed protein product [Callosobruchus analis]